MVWMGQEKIIVGPALRFQGLVTIDATLPKSALPLLEFAPNRVFVGGVHTYDWFPPASSPPVLALFESSFYSSIKVNSRKEQLLRGRQKQGGIVLITSR